MPILPTQNKQEITEKSCATCENDDSPHCNICKDYSEWEEVKEKQEE